MATRNLSARFLALRSTSQATGALSKLSSSNAAAAAAAASHDEEAGLPLVEFSDTPAVGQPPAWVAVHETMTKDLSSVFAQSQWPPHRRTRPSSTMHSRG